MPPPLADRIALVTGASRGIGYATAFALAKAGAHIIAVARTVGGLEELDDAIKALGGSATLVPLDLKDHAGIDRLGLALHERFGRLDVLVGNAAILGPLSPLGHVEATAWDDVMAVNVTANWRLICAMDQLLKFSDAGRVVFVSSGVSALAPPIGGPTPSAKRRSRPWRALMLRNRQPPMCASIYSHPGRSARACALRQCRARIP
jgi:NAD(P)-dependent dehydrogenase (short-subunit alcohol dehydrogenase family)